MIEEVIRFRFAKECPTRLTPKTAVQQGISWAFSVSYWQQERGSLGFLLVFFNYSLLMPICLPVGRIFTQSPFFERIFAPVIFAEPIGR